MHDAKKLTRATIFEGMTLQDIEDICSRGRDVSVDAGHRLFERGQEARELIVLRDGAVELVFPIHVMGAIRDLAMETKQSGDVVAWSALVSPYQFTLSARCASACELTALSREVLDGFFEASPAVGYLFLRNLAGVIGRRLQTLHAMWMRDLQANAMK